MEKILELGDSQNNKYPQHFQVFLDNCVKTYAEFFGANDYLFAAVYFSVMETGFGPSSSLCNFCGHDSISFDIRKLRSVTTYTADEVKISASPGSGICCVYKIYMRLGVHVSSTCELQGVPSAENSSHLIINFLSKKLHTIKSLCLNTDAYVFKNENPSEHKYVLKNLKALSHNIKNKVVGPLKDLILMCEGEGCSPNLLCLPEEIQKRILSFLKYDAYSVHALSSTCSYFYGFIKNDTKLWEEICFREFSGWELNRALQDVCVKGDVNVFRTAFLHLKTKKVVGHSGSNIQCELPSSGLVSGE